MGAPTIQTDVSIVFYLASVQIVASRDNPCIARQFSFPSLEVSLLKPSCEPE